MSAISITKFGGMVPRLPEDLLPDEAASYASNCDFSKIALAPLKRGYLLVNIEPVTAAGKGMYTIDGIYWYTWATEVVAYKSPVIADSYNRVYYIEANTLYAAPSPEDISAPRTSFTYGGAPINKWKVGVPNPTAAPTLVLVDRTTLPDYPTASFSFKVWWSDGATNYGNTSVSATTVAPFKQYTFTAPTPPVGTPDGTTLIVQATLSDGTKNIFTLNSDTNSTAAVRSQALPGGVEMMVTYDSSLNKYTVYFTWGVVETRSYIYTMQNTWDEESGPSPATIVSPTYLQNVEVTTTTPSFTGYRPWKQTNIYRTYGTATYIKTNATLKSGTTYTDSSNTVGSASTALKSLEWVPPPTGIFGLIAMPNGWFACFKDNVLHMSEPYRPHAWPYSIIFPKSITGICAGPQGMVVTTYEGCYIVLGPHPASVNQQELPIPVGGISQRGMVKFENGVAYLSNDGIVVVQGSFASLELSQNLFTREVWRQSFGSYLSTMGLAYHDGFLVCTSDTHTVGFLVRLDEAAGAFTRHDYRYDCMQRLPVLDTLYYTSNGAIYRFRDFVPYTATWHSKEFGFPVSTKWGIGYAQMSGSGSATVRLLDTASGFYHDQVVTPSAEGTWFRIPAHKGGFSWKLQITVTGDCLLHQLAFAHSMQELKSV